LISVPWNKESKSNADIKTAEKILDEDHYALQKAKERITEYLAVHQLAKKIKDLINSEGYYQTFFSLEKSTLFKQYLLTGLDCLYKEVSVAELAQEHPNQYLTKEQFEKFTDLLMVSQSG
jgi:hypothetical protein